MIRNYIILCLKKAKKQNCKCSPLLLKVCLLFSLDMKNGIPIGLKVTEMQPITCECYSSCCVITISSLIIHYIYHSLFFQLVKPAAMNIKINWNFVIFCKSLFFTLLSDNLLGNSTWQSKSCAIVLSYVPQMNERTFFILFANCSFF